MDHVCACRACSPDAFPPEALTDRPNNPGHFAARWLNGHQRLDAFLDNKPVEACTEIMTGADGWAIVFNGHGCPCGAHECCESVRYGHATVSGVIPV